MTLQSRWSFELIKNGHFYSSGLDALAVVASHQVSTVIELENKNAEKPRKSRRKCVSPFRRLVFETTTNTKHRRLVSFCPSFQYWSARVAVGNWFSSRELWRKRISFLLLNTTHTCLLFHCIVNKQSRRKKGSASRLHSKRSDTTGSRKQYSMHLSSRHDG